MLKRNIEIYINLINNYPEEYSIIYVHYFVLKTFLMINNVNIQNVSKSFSHDQLSTPKLKINYQGKTGNSLEF